MHTTANEKAASCRRGFGRAHNGGGRAEGERETKERALRVFLFFSLFLALRATAAARNFALWRASRRPHVDGGIATQTATTLDKRAKLNVKNASSAERMST